MNKKPPPGNVADIHRMFGPFRQSVVALGGLLWKRPWRMLKHQKRRLRERMRQVDHNIATLHQGLLAKGCVPALEARTINAAHAQEAKTAALQALNPVNVQSKPKIGYEKIIPHIVEDLVNNLPKELEMEPKDKYTHYLKYAKNYRKGVHMFPKWTKLTLRENPRGF